MSVHLLKDVAIACQSAWHAALRGVGLSQKRAYVVLVEGKPLFWRDVDTGVSGSGGFFTTRVVMARSRAEAGARAIGVVKEAVVSFAGNPDDRPVDLRVEDCTEVRGVAWRQPTGFTLWESEEEP